MRELAAQGMPMYSRSLAQRAAPRLGMGEQLASMRAALDDAASKELVDALIRQCILRLEPSWENRRELARDPAVRALMSEHDERGPGASIFIDRISAYSYIIFDTPPLLVAADSIPLSSYIDGIVLVVQAARTTTKTASHAISLIKDSNILGIVLNKVPRDLAKNLYPYYHLYGNEGYHKIPKKSKEIENS